MFSAQLLPDNCVNEAMTKKSKNIKQLPYIPIFFEYFYWHHNHSFKNMIFIVCPKKRKKRNDNKGIAHKEKCMISRFLKVDVVLEELITLIKLIKYGDNG